MFRANFSVNASLDKNLHPDSNSTVIILKFRSGTGLLASRCEKTSEKHVFDLQTVHSRGHYVLLFQWRIICGFENQLSGLNIQRLRSVALSN